VADGVTTLDDPGNPVIVQLANNTQANYDFDYNEQAHRSTLAGIGLQAWQNWDSLSVMLNANVQSNTSEELKFGQAVLPYQQTTESEQPCPGYKDPTQDVLAELNRMMVWAGM
jgi:hypothetical protein